LAINAATEVRGGCHARPSGATAVEAETVEVWTRRRGVAAAAGAPAESGNPQPQRCMVTDFEPRQHKRYPVDLRVDYTTRDAFVANRVSNLSQGGLFIATETPLPVQSELDLVLTLQDDAERIRARGRVIWNYDIRKGTSRLIAGMGIRFVDLSPDDRRRLVDFIATLRPASVPTPAASEPPTGRS